MAKARTTSITAHFFRALLTVLFAVGANMLLTDSSFGDDKRGDFLLSPKSTFQKYCGACHGPTGHGDGRYYATSLAPKPADLTTQEMSARDDKYLFSWISQGSAAMGKSNLCPPWGYTITEEQIRGIVAYVKKLSRKN